MARRMNTPVTDLFIIVVNWNTAETLVECLRSVKQSTRSLAYNVCVVDNGSTDGSAEAVSKYFPEVFLILNKTNFGFAKANNQGLSIANSRYVMLLNSDTVVPNGALDSMVAFADGFGERLGVLAPKLLGEDGKIQNSIAPFPSLTKSLITRFPFSKHILSRRISDHYLIRSELCNNPCEVDYASGACLLVNKQVIDQVGGLDENYFMYGEEIDWCYSIRKAGWLVIYNPEIKIIHLGNQSGKSKWGNSGFAARKYAERMFYRKFYGGLAAKIFQTTHIIMSTMSFVKHKTLLRFSIPKNQKEIHYSEAEKHLLVIKVLSGLTDLQNIAKRPD